MNDRIADCAAAVLFRLTVTPSLLERSNSKEQSNSVRDRKTKTGGKNSIKGKSKTVTKNDERPNGTVWL